MEETPKSKKLFIDTLLNFLGDSYTLSESQNMTPTATFYRSGGSSIQNSMSPYAKKNHALLSALSRSNNSRLSTNVHTQREGYSNPVSAFRPYGHKINLSPGPEIVSHLNQMN